MKYPLIKIPCGDCTNGLSYDGNDGCQTCGKSLGMAGYEKGSGIIEKMVGKLPDNVRPQKDNLWFRVGSILHSKRTLLEKYSPFAPGKTYDTTSGSRVAGEVSLIKAGELGSSLQGDLIKEWEFRKLVMVDWEGTAHTWLCIATATKGGENEG